MLGIIDSIIGEPPARSAVPPGLEGGPTSPRYCGRSVLPVAEQ
jgi:hypothetical protein